ncbi:MAG: nickel pincer cofactor biosynthesis protein LarC [Lachnospiraceae bacterium]|nr:nickel pincer cofactor biosynthesis protein LarC [Lachnospiraceae bacterium]MBD5456115.1 nickel pincer cofactor biosynthesis protein LarC [Lachnospiraceae bacterium]
MRILFLECNMGAAGDMLMAALLELHPDREDFIKRLNHIGIPHVSIEAMPSEKCGISGTHMQVVIKGQEEGEEAHSHHHEHAHMSMQEIMEIVDGLQVSKWVKDEVQNIYQLIAQAESKVHGKDVTEIHFHEVGMMDAIVDITGCVMLIQELNVDKIVASPVNVGFGQVKCAHGILPVPAPATALLLQGIPCYAGNIEGELCTPTGAAILKYFTNEYGRMPQMTIEKIGYGFGKKDFEAVNCIRAILGETESEDDQIVELCCNLDDMTPEEIGYAAELFLEEGALDVFTTAIGMKKGRPGVMLTVTCRAIWKEEMAELIFKHTTTIGIRESFHNRMVMERKEYVKESKYGKVRMKECTGYGITKTKPEYEDLREIALETGLSLREIKEKGGF